MHVQFGSEEKLNDCADYKWLTSDEAKPWLAECAQAGESSARLQQRLRKSLTAEQARLVVWQVALRRKAVEKFGDSAAVMFFTDLALQQSTDRWVASYKASRFQSGTPILDYCCGIGGDLLALARQASTTGWDRAPEMVLFAQANLRAWNLETKSRVLLGSVEDHPPETEHQWHLDPDRRTDGRRSTHVEWHSPNAQTIKTWLRTAPTGAIKLAPATELSDEWEAQAELEWISRGRECRQLVAWFGDMAKFHGLRRATKVVGESCESFLGNPSETAELAESIGAYIYDTDPAIRAAKLTGALAMSQKLSALSSGESYLTAESRIDHPLLSCFKVTDRIGLRMPDIKALLRSRKIGELEIKTRGVSTNPQQIRQAVKLSGNNSATLLLTRHGKREIAILAERVSTG
jgi:hypothetical protein